MLALKSFLLSNSELFGEVIDYFFITKFLNRGNEHESGLLWIQGAHVYGKAYDDVVVQFIDKYISFNSYEF